MPTKKLLGRQSWPTKNVLIYACLTHNLQHQLLALVISVHRFHFGDRKRKQTYRQRRGILKFITGVFQKKNLQPLSCNNFKNRSPVPVAKILSYWGKNRHCSRVRVKFVFADWRFFCVLRELIFVIRTNWFFLLGINICDFQKVPGTQH